MIGMMLKEKELFKDIILELNDSMSDKTIINKVRVCLKDKDRLLKLIKENKEQVQPFNVQNWVKDIIGVCK